MKEVCKICGAKATQYCEDCGRQLCDVHGDRDKHNCDDRIKGCHGVWARG